LGARLLAFDPAQFLHLQFGSCTVFSSIFSTPPAAIFFVQIFGPRVSGLVPAEVRPMSSSCTCAEKHFGPFPLSGARRHLYFPAVLQAALCLVSFPSAGL
jgi:hypothetical protein